MILGGDSLKEGAETRRRRQFKCDKEAEQLALHTLPFFHKGV